MKNFNDFIEQAAAKVLTTESAKNCPKGKYWCYTDKKCKPIPSGYFVGRRGYLEPEEDSKNKKNGNGNGYGNGNGNGNGGNGNGGNGGNGGGGMGESFINLPLNVEIPKNQTEFDLGLMFRESLDEDSGMLFVFEDVSKKHFHMKNTVIPLDIAFINEYGIIESIEELSPLKVLPISSPTEVLYALEVNRGWFKKNNVNIGDKVLNINPN